MLLCPEPETKVTEETETQKNRNAWQSLEYSPLGTAVSRSSKDSEI